MPEPLTRRGLLQGSADDESDESGAAEQEEKPNPFAALEKLKQGGPGGKKH